MNTVFKEEKDDIVFDYTKLDEEETDILIELARTLSRDELLKKGFDEHQMKVIQKWAYG